jgi:hypothetical protein
MSAWWLVLWLTIFFIAVGIITYVVVQTLRKRSQVHRVRGPRGRTGPQGHTGAQGEQGDDGPQGVAGDATNTGATGATGNTGSQGVAGTAVNTGATGPTGIHGNTGSTGPQGVPGFAANTGATGTIGPTGTTGYTGPIGVPGTATNTGATGNTGPTGSTGPQGVAGTAVNTGATGLVGPTGLRGETGSTGPTGVPGTSTNTGATGPQGDAATGPTGASGPQGIPGTAVNTGATGIAGSTGPTGPVLQAFGFVLGNSLTPTLVADAAFIPFEQGAIGPELLVNGGAGGFFPIEGSYTYDFSVAAARALTTGFIFLALNSNGVDQPPTWNSPEQVAPGEIVILKGSGVVSHPVTFSSLQLLNRSGEGINLPAAAFAATASDDSHWFNIHRVGPS